MVLVCFGLVQATKNAVCIHMSIFIIIYIRIYTSFCQVVGVFQNSGQTTFVHIIVEVTIFICETPPHRNIAVARFYLERFWSLGWLWWPGSNFSGTIRQCQSPAGGLSLRDGDMGQRSCMAKQQTLFVHLQSLHTSFAPSILTPFKPWRWTKSWDENSNSWEREFSCSDQATLQWKGDPTRELAGSYFQHTDDTGWAASFCKR